MVGGDAATFTRAEDAMWAYAKAITLIGPVGSGQLTKMVNQICLAGLTPGAGRGAELRRAAGLDAEKVLGVISKGAAQSWMMDNRSQTMLADQFDFGFAVDWMRKDLRIALDEARRNGARKPARRSGNRRSPPCSCRPGSSDRRALPIIAALARRERKDQRCPHPERPAISDQKVADLRDR